MDEICSDISGTLARIKQALEVHTDSDVVEILGKASGSASQWKRRGRIPAGVLAQVSERTGVSIRWLKTGEKQSEVRESPAAYDRLNGFILIPRYTMNIKSECLKDRVPFREEWIREEMCLDPSRLALIQTSGDGMEPVLHPGDLMMFDLGTKQVKDNAIYALSAGDSLLVKRIQKKIDGSLVIKSDNPAYEPEEIEAGRARDLQVIGRLVWAGRRF